jgi:TatD DNase family protein
MRVRADCLLVETDAPYLAPQARRGQRNEPAFVVDTLALLGEFRAEETAALGRQVTENARKLFGIRF